MNGPDHKASLNPKEFSLFVKSIRNTEKLLGNGKKFPSPSEKKILKLLENLLLLKQTLKLVTFLAKKI